MMSESGFESEAEIWCNALRAHGFRLTRACRAIVAAILRTEGTVSAEQLCSQVQTIRPGIGRATVYRTLEKLGSLNLIQRLHDDHGCHAYIRTPSDHEGLLVCKHCGRVDNLSRESVQSAVSDLTAGSGYHVQHYLIQLFGLCKHCALAHNAGA